MSDFSCLFCPCVFSSQVDLDLHLTAFGSGYVSHLRLWRCVHALIEVYGVYSDVDSQGLFVVSDTFLCLRDGLSCSKLVYAYGSHRRLHRTCLKCDVLPLAVSSGTMQKLGEQPNLTK